MPSELTRVKKIRGGQKGNQNARKHGFYSSTLTPEEISQIWTLISQEHVSPDVAILRIKLMSMVHQAPADHRVLKEVVKIIVQWYAKKNNLGRADRAVMQAAVAEVFEQSSGISLNNNAQKLLLLENEISINLSVK
jgi:uncharacterized protein YjcR